MIREIEKEVAEVLLDKGVSLPLLRFKLPFRRCYNVVRITMKRPTLGNLIQIAEVYATLDNTLEELQKMNKTEELLFIAANGKKLSKMIALAVLRGGAKSAFWANSLAWLIRKFVPADYVYYSALTFATMLSTSPFIPIITSAEVANPLTPRVSQKEIRS